MRFTPRTRWLLVCGAAAVSIATAVSGAVAATAAKDPLGSPSSAAGSQRPSARPTAGGDAPAPAPAPVGDVIPGGLSGKSADWVFWAERVDVPELPDVSFGIMAGLRTTASLTPLVMSNEVTGSDRARGFHAVQGGMVVGEKNVATPAFGYYAGPAARITASKGGRAVTARQAAWSEDPSVVVFWFDPAQVGEEFVPEGLAAFDSAGKRLPLGNAEAGVG